MRIPSYLYTSLFFVGFGSAIAAAVLYYGRFAMRSYSSEAAVYQDLSRQVKQQLQGDYEMLERLGGQLEARSLKDWRFLDGQLPSRYRFIVQVNGKTRYSNFSWMVPDASFLNQDFMRFGFIDTDYCKAFITKHSITQMQKGRTIELFLIQPIYYRYPVAAYGFQSGYRGLFKELSIGVAQQGKALLAPNGEFLTGLQLDSKLPISYKSPIWYPWFMAMLVVLLYSLLLSASLFIMQLMQTRSQWFAFLSFVLVYALSLLFLYQASQTGLLPDHWFFSSGTYAYSNLLLNPASVSIVVLAFFTLAGLFVAMPTAARGATRLGIVVHTAFVLLFALFSQVLVSTLFRDGQYDFQLSQVRDFGASEFWVGSQFLLLSFALVLIVSKLKYLVNLRQHLGTAFLALLVLGGLWVALAYWIPLFHWATTSAFLLALGMVLLQKPSRQDMHILLLRVFPWMVMAFVVDLAFRASQVESSRDTAQVQRAQLSSLMGLIDFHVLEFCQSVEGAASQETQEKWELFHEGTPLYLYSLQKPPDSLTEEQEAEPEFVNEYLKRYSCEGTQPLLQIQPQLQAWNPLHWSLQYLSPSGQWIPSTEQALSQDLLLGQDKVSWWSRSKRLMEEIDLSRFFFYLFVYLAAQSFILFIYGWLSGSMRRSFVNRLSQTLLVGFLLPVMLLMGLYLANLRRTAEEQVARAYQQNEQPLPREAKREALRVVPGFFFWPFAPHQDKNQLLREIQVGELSALVVLDGDQMGIYFGYSWQVWEEMVDKLGLLFGVLSIFLLLLIFFSQYFAALLSRPISDFSERLSQADLDRAQPWYWASEDEFGKLSKTYNSMLRRLENSRIKLAQQEKELAWKEMARQVAHEIKNPLTPMKLSLQHMQNLIRGGEIPKEQLKNKISSLESQVDTLTEIANSFSDFAKMPDPKLESFDLREPIRKVVHLYSDNDEVLIDAELPEEAVMVKSDEKLMGRVVTNLVLNGIQAVPHERQPILKVELSSAGKKAELKITDNGSGIPPEVEDKIFVPNFSTKFTGSGIGLAVAKRAIEYSGGEIFFESHEDKGTTFAINLPLSLI